jgi:hypothetical protein
LLCRLAQQLLNFERFGVRIGKPEQSGNPGTSKRLAIPSAFGEADFSCLPMMLVMGHGLIESVFSYLHFSPFTFRFG